MQRAPRVRMNAADKFVSGEPWTQGAPLGEIRRTLGHVPAACRHLLRARGGMPHEVSARKRGTRPRRTGSASARVKTPSDTSRTRITAFSARA